MKTLLLFSVLAASAMRTQAQDYRALEFQEMASRIHVSKAGSLPPLRIAGADYATRKGDGRQVLSLREERARLDLDGKTYHLDPRQAKSLKMGLPVGITKDLQVTLFSDINNRSQAVLIVQSTGLDGSVHQIVRLQISAPSKEEGQPDQKKDEP